MGSGSNVLETERLVLRRLTADDAAFVLRLVNEPSWLQNIGDRGIRTLDDASAYIESSPIAMYERLGHGLYRVEIKASDVAVGICGLIKRETLEDVDLGFAILEEFQRRGYAFESARAVMDLEAPTLGLSRVVAVTSTENVASAQLLEKLGFRFKRHIQLAPEGGLLRLFSATIGI